jgi:hypothetical protein
MNPSVTIPPANVQAIVETNAFVIMLAELGNGRVVTACSEKMGQLIAAVKHTGKKGEFSLKLTIKPDGKGEVQSVDIEDDVKAKCPERDKRPTSFFVTGENELTRNDPGQKEMDFPAQPKAQGVAKAAAN